MFSRRINASRWLGPALLTCIVLYAALLRFDALFKSYGPHEEPRWLAALQPAVTAAAARTTQDWSFRHDPDPYAGGDPINYLRFAREMRNFYAAHVREPGFPAATRLGLILAGDADVGISLTSIAFALLGLVATYLLGRQLASSAVGLAAAAALAIDQRAVTWAIGGWRDEMFAFFAVLATWAWLRLYQQRTYGRAVWAGLASAGACLTRITSITLIAPAMLWLVATRDREGRPVRETALAGVILMALVAPFLINCAIATGDPLYAINNHTDFYLKREGVADPAPISAVEYTWTKFERPLAATDTMVTGILVYPFSNKWVGLDRWWPGLGQALSWLAIGGMFAWLWSREGRFVLFMFLGALIPFSATWNVRGGAEWRLTLFAYSYYLIAAFWLVEHMVRHAGEWRRVFDRRTLRPAAALAAFIALGVSWTWYMPYAVVRESLQRGEPAIIRAGERDRYILAAGWADLSARENVMERFADGPVATLRIPLPESRPYKIVLRMDPLPSAGDIRETVHIALNGWPAASFDLTWNPDRVGQYEFSIPAAAVRRGANQLELRSPRGLRLWYLLIVPQ